VLSYCYQNKKLSPEGCEIIMTEKFIGIDIEVAENNGLETPFAGLIPLLQMCKAMKLPEFINQSLHVHGEKGFIAGDNDRME
jgi:hypothetical protein